MTALYITTLNDKSFFHNIQTMWSGFSAGLAGVNTWRIFSKMYAIKSTRQVKYNTASLSISSLMKTMSTLSLFDAFLAFFARLTPLEIFLRLRKANIINEKSFFNDVSLFVILPRRSVGASGWTVARIFKNNKF